MAMPVISFGLMLCGLPFLCFVWMVVRPVFVGAQARFVRKGFWATSWLFFAQSSTALDAIALVLFRGCGDLLFLA